MAGTPRSKKSAYEYAPTDKPVGKLDFYYKVVAEDGKDLYSRTFSYPETVGMCAYIAGEEGMQTPQACSPTVLHASPSVPLAIFYGLHLVNRTQRAQQFRLFEVYGEPVVKDDKGGKFGFREFDVLREVTTKAEIIELLRADPKGRERVSFTNGKLTAAEATAIWTYCFDTANPFHRKTKPTILNRS